MAFHPKFVEISANFSTDFHWILIHGHIASKGLTPDHPALMEKVIYRSHKDQPQFRTSYRVIGPSTANDGKRHGKAEHWTVNIGHAAVLCGLCSLLLMCESYLLTDIQNIFHITCPLGIPKTPTLCQAPGGGCRPSLNLMLCTIYPYIQDELSVTDNNIQLPITDLHQQGALSTARRLLWLLGMHTPSLGPGAASFSLAFPFSLSFSFLTF